MADVIAGAVGFASGFIVAGGVVALMIGLGILTRFIGITHTAGSIMRYENAVLFGSIGGMILTVFPVQIPWGRLAALRISFFAEAAVLLLLLMGGLFIGIFVGGWIMALSEVIHVFPVYCRRLGIKKGLSLIVIAMAAGKILGSLLFFGQGWGI